MVEIVFLGTGGGRINLLKQIRATGGFRINSKSANIHIDPGPGALLHSLRLKQDIMKLDAIIVTHHHIDHVNDAAILIEAMSGHTIKKGGMVIGSNYVINSDEDGDRSISKYHQSLVSDICVAEIGSKKILKTKKGEFEMEFIKTKHDDPGGFGFKLNIDGKVVGYTSDTEYYEGIGENYQGCDYLIVNCLKPAVDKYPGHMTTQEVAKLVKAAKPKFAVITHMGMKIIMGNPEGEAKKIEKFSGIPCISAHDGQKIGTGLESYL